MAEAEQRSSPSTKQFAHQRHCAALTRRTRQGDGLLVLHFLWISEDRNCRRPAGFLFRSKILLVKFRRNRWQASAKLFYLYFGSFGEPGIISGKREGLEPNTWSCLCRDEHRHQSGVWHLTVPKPHPEKHPAQGRMGMCSFGVEFCSFGNPPRVHLIIHDWQFYSGPRSLQWVLMVETQVGMPHRIF